MTEKETALFEIAGLGKGPFKFCGVFTIPNPAANPTAYENALREVPPFHCGTCAYCGMGIMNNYLVQSSDGNRFSVGCECIAKIGSKKLETEAKAYRREMERKKREEKRIAKIEARLQEERDRNGGLTDFELWEKEDAERRRVHKIKMDKRAALMKDLADCLDDQKGGFRQSVAVSMRSGELPHGKGRSIALEILAKQEGRKGSKAYDAEFDRIADIFDAVEAI